MDLVARVRAATPAWSAVHVSDEQIESRLTRALAADPWPFDVLRGS